MPTRFLPRVFEVPLAEGGSTLPMKYATDGQSGVLEMTDDRGRHVLAAYAPVPTLGLGLMLKTDISELDAPVVQRFVPFGLLLLLITAGGGWLLRKSVAPLAGRLAKSEEQLRMALDGSRISLWDWDIRTGKVSLSEHWSVMIGGPPKPVSGSVEELVAILHPDDTAAVLQHVEQLLRGALTHYDIEHRVRTLSGDWKWIRSRGHIVAHAADGKPLRALGTNVDISERKAYELELAHHAAHDVLTGLPNRGLFEDRLQQAITRAVRSRSLIAVLYIDVDGFKGINDSLGHATGDVLLKELARGLNILVRSTDTIARLGGDEFAVILESLDHQEDGLRIASSVVAAMRRTFNLEDRQVSTSGSVGVAFLDGAAGDADGADLLARADRALYAAKAAGRDCLCIDPQSRPAKRLRLA
jgi:diguanylate cyclase (GGDEF)-like protein/PAS domain S-box-containing protein